MVGDWIVGLSPKSFGNKIIYAMRVDEIAPFSRYYQDERFSRKIPDFTKTGVVNRCGDNIYKPLADGGFHQIRSMHSHGENENLETKNRDLRGRNVLISKTFYYFGSKAPNLPEALEDLKVGRAHKNKFSPTIISAFMDFLSKKKAGVNAPPTDWPLHDESWKAIEQ
jgi:hypothetical protein